MGASVARRPALMSGQPNEEPLAAPDFNEIELALTSTAIAGDAGGLYRIASNLMDEGVPFDSLLFDYLMETERSVGQRWAQGDYLVAEEHAVTAAIETVISLLVGMFDQPVDGDLVVIATAEGDEHSLPARAVSAHLLFQGYRTMFLGADLPGDQLSQFLETEAPAVLVLSAAMSTHLLGVRSVVEAAHDAGIPVVVGGKAFGPDGVWAQSVGADAWVSRLRDVEAIVESWIDAPPDLNTAPQISSELRELLDHSSTVLARADQLLGPDRSQRLQSEVRLLVSSIEGGLLTGDDRVIAEMLEWQHEAMSAHGEDPSKVLNAVQSAIGEFSQPGLGILETAASRS